ncbi:MAG: hypothetical protein C4K58_04755 [Flavobacteriaceae bacterium]|nr:MAG: hypothetical protein C4K58_04755 [Flavobacteriaceae bacterium]
MSISVLLDQFQNQNLDLSVLKELFPDFTSTYFSKANLGKTNSYPNGVVSVTMEGTGDKLPSTIGLLPVGEFAFEVGSNTETMHFLSGDLSWGVKGESLVQPKTGDTLVIPFDQTLILEVKSPSIYICDYSPKEN